MKVLWIFALLPILSGCSFNISEPPRIIPEYSHLALSDIPFDTLSAGDAKGISIDFEPRRNRLAALSSKDLESSTLDFWQVATGILERSFPNPDFMDLEVRFSNDGKSIAIGSSALIVVRSDNFKLRRAFTADAYMDEKLISLDTETAWPFAIRDVELRKKYHYVSALAFSPDDRFIVSGHDNNLVRVWEMKTGAMLGMLEMSSIYGKVTGVEFSPDGRFIAAVQHNGKIYIWRFPDYSGYVLDMQKEPVNAIAFDPFSGLLAAGCTDGSIRIWDIEEKRLVKSLRLHLKEILTIDFSGDGLFIASAGSDEKIALTEVSTGKPVVYLDGHSGRVNDVAFNSNASILASSSDDGILLAWDISSLDLGKDPAAIPVPVSPPDLSCTVEYIDASGDGVLSAGEKSTLRISVTNNGGGAAYQLVSMALPDSIDQEVRVGRIPIIPMILPGATRTVETGVVLGAGSGSGYRHYHLRIYEYNGFHLPKPVRFRIPL